MKSNDSGEEEPLVAGGAEFEVPIWFRWVASGVALVLIVPPALFLIRYSLTPERFASPTDVGVIQLILAGTAVLLFALAPWKAFGLRLKKVGFLEFERVISGQAKEHAQELTELRVRIDELETKARGMHGLGSIGEDLEDIKLMPLLTKFLDVHRPKAFSPLRIRDWGSRQLGFEELATAPLASIRRILQRLVSDGRAATRVSRMGSTLYKVPDGP